MDSEKPIQTGFKYNLVAILFNILILIKPLNFTWKRMKWIKRRTHWGRLNQKNLLFGSTIGAPLTTVVLSWISSAISMIISSSLVPTTRSICISKYKIKINSNNLILCLAVVLLKVFISCWKAWRPLLSKHVFTKKSVKFFEVLCYPNRADNF